ncbi:MAG TPA: UDP-N-acetylglucosamine 2-epimerase (non-hydrolyzing) [Candidatus Dormibacteraeota bacterium]|nr:UDP-N-acetylglucosamine 2-epimerase (non-hydrolyzing) [Candidatus Dormibacteraeota bacterium]
MHILHVVGARPNFMKAAPVLRALSATAGVRQTLVHTGQHYDNAMSDVFFQQLEMPQPDCNLGVGSGTHAQQTAAVMQAFEPVLLERKPDLVLVYGDVNSTVAAALVCSKLNVRVGHVEAGLRSRDRTMPEEINRLVTDQLSDLLFTPSADGDENLLREGIDRSKIHLVGNVMIDTLLRLLPRAEEHFPATVSSPYALVTLHRPSNVDDVVWLRELLATLAELSGHLHIVFPVHPRTRQRIESATVGVATGTSPVPRSEASGEGKNSAAILAQTMPPTLHLLKPLPYLEFLALQRHAAIVITDSGGIQEEATFLGIPCLTVRENTERPITITHGTNQLVGRDLRKLRSAAEEILRSKPAAPRQEPDRNRVPLWDGHAAERIARIIVRGSTQER